MDTADTLAIDDSELDVTLITPSGGPGVLDEPVLLAVLSAITNSEDSVVETGAARCVGHYTAPVRLEDSFVGLDKHGERLLLESSLHLINIVLLNCLVVTDIDGGRGLAHVVRTTLPGGVRARYVYVGVFEISLVVLVVVHGACRLTALAAVGAIGGAISAVNKLLLRE